MESLPAVDYEGGRSGEDLFSLWENGRPAHLLAPLSVRRPRYRQIIVKLAVRCAPYQGCSVLSLGAGNGFTEAALSKEGFRVVASDKSPTALSYCAKKGLPTVLYDLLNPPSEALRRFDVLYCDGLLGHLWEPEIHYRHIWQRLAECGTAAAILIVSNDLADGDEAPMFQVTGNPAARFFRPPARWFAQDATESGLWTPQTTRILHYMRRALRRREILVLKRSLMYERKI